MNTNYKIEISLTTNRELTESELNHLVNAVAVQVEEPSGFNGDKRAAFTVLECVFDVSHTVTA